MQILKFAPMLACILLTYGCTKPSPEYEHIRRLPYDQWAAYGETLPVKKRIDLQLEIVRRSGHPPSMDMVPAFKADPGPTYGEIIKRLRSGDRNRYYQMIIYEIDGPKGFKICDQQDRRVIQDFLNEIATPAVKLKDRPDFYFC